MCDLVMFWLYEKIGSLRYTEIPKADAFHYIISRNHIHWYHPKSHFFKKKIVVYWDAVKFMMADTSFLKF